MSAATLSSTLRKDSLSTLELITPTIITLKAQQSIPPPLNQPLTWLWACHICKRSYPLGVTRRCLDCGHHFCAGGVVENKTLSRKYGRPIFKKQRACTSEFDYCAWKEWNDCRRRYVSDPVYAQQQKGCWESCDFPSQCRWGNVDSSTRLNTIVSVTSHPVDEVSKNTLGDGKRDRWAQLIASTLKRSKSGQLLDKIQDDNVGDQ